MKWTEEELEKATSLLKEGLSYFDIGLKLNRGADSVRGKLQKSGLGYREYQKEVRKCLECGCEFSVTKKSSKRFCNNSCSATHYNKKREKKKYGHCLECGKELNRKGKKYCNNKCQGESKRKKVFKLIENGNIALATKNYKNFLISKCGDSCMKCGWREVHSVTGLVPVQLDHIDGNSDNNNLDNLRLLCPNCHSLTPTFGNLNSNNGSSKRKEYRKKYRKKQV